MSTVSPGATNVRRWNWVQQGLHRRLSLIFGSAICRLGAVEIITSKGFRPFLASATSAVSILKSPI
jgi:hypothetical protein